MKNKHIFFLILFLFLSPLFLFAQVNEDVTVTASVGTVAEEPVLGGGTYGSNNNYYNNDVPETGVSFSGVAYPFAQVFILESGIEKTEVAADQYGNFSTTFDEEFNEGVFYSLFALDKNNEKSLILNYPLVIHEGYITHLSGIRFPPTISTDKAEARAGDYLQVYGSAYASSEIEITIRQSVSSVSRTYQVAVKEDGTYTIFLPLSGFSKGEYYVNASYKNDTRISKLVRLTVGNTNVPAQEVVANLPGDCNSDSIITLVDFSILAFWYKRPNPPVCVDLNKDNIVNLIDFSILAFYWTG